MEKIKKKHLYQYYSDIFQAKKSILFFQVNSMESFHSYLNDFKIEFESEEVKFDTFFLKNSVFKKVLAETKFSSIIPVISGQIFVISFGDSIPVTNVFNKITSTVHSVIFLGGILKEKLIVAEDLLYLKEIYNKNTNQFCLFNHVVSNANLSMLKYLSSEQRFLLYLLEQRKRQLCSSY